MYRIIGGDGQEYGPVSAGDVRQWIAEGRLNAASRIRPEGATEWTTLGALPEFASGAQAAPAAAYSAAPYPTPGAAPQGYGTYGGGREEAAQKTKGPGTALLVTGVLSVIASLLSLVMRFVRTPELPPDLPPQAARFLELMMGPAGMISDIVGLSIGGLIIFAGVSLIGLRRYALAFTVSILAMIPCISPCCLLGLPFGIWALVVLNKPEVKSQFT